MSDVRLAIVGSTRFADCDGRDAIDAARLIASTIDGLAPTVVISGGAKGIDSMAAAVAREKGVPVIEHLPDNPRWEPDGYRARNLRIAEDCTHLLCIRHSASRTYGSGWTANWAEKMGKTVMRHTFGETP